MMANIFNWLHASFSKIISKRIDQKILKSEQQTKTINTKFTQITKSALK